MSASVVNGHLVCELCQKSTEFDLVEKRGVMMHLCKKCRKLSQCSFCGVWRRILISTPHGPMCRRHA